ncbi:MAG: para-aminobenzoate synthetase component 1 [Luteibaculaceae bacterium]|jgi:para-aminobenzoate synthetase component 1
MKPAYTKYSYQVPTEAFWFTESLDPTICFLNSNNPKAWNYLAFGEELSVDNWGQFKKEQAGKWWFGYLSYNLKDTFLFNQKPQEKWFPNLFQFQPRWIVRFKPGQVEVYGNPKKPKAEFDAWVDQLFFGDVTRGSVYSGERQEFQLTARTPHRQYIFNVKAIKKHIQNGDIYEANYCQEFYAHQKIDPVSAYWNLNKKSRSPFSAYLQFDHFRVLSGSPERFLKKEGDTLISQPIKGTARRAENPEEDQQLARELELDPKERSENVMIVDLVRNDLSKLAKKGSVHVSELCGLHTFPTVHQLISTVECALRPEVGVAEIIEATFPMGSMTGAPKKRAVELMDQFEDFERGVYSGAIGYFTEEGDFDLNVVIRSVLYDAEKPYISVPVGGAITTNSDPEKEYLECQTKIKAIRELFGG